jgi:Lon protease-like protein
VAGNPITAAGNWAVLPLFPLQTVLFPGGLLQLRVFEARYLDLISDCLRSQSPFGVVCLARGGELRSASDKPKLEATAVLATVQDVDAEQTGILRVRCLGGARVLLGSPHQRADGLWLSDGQAGPEDAPAPVPPELAAAAKALAQAIVALAAQDQHPFALPHRLDEAGWVANRWCEILPISTAAKYRLMVLDQPVLRLKLVDEYLRGKGIL